MRDSCEVHTGDLRVLDEARAAARGCSHVIHLAAIVGGIGNFHKLPHTLTEVNNALYNAIFRAALEQPVERLVYVSSSMVFERAKEFPTTEEHIRDTPIPESAYGFSKLTGEIYCHALHDEHGLPYTICRPFNAYGPGEMPEDEPGIAHMVPDVIRKVLAGQRPLQIFGSGEQTRTLTHIDDIAEGIWSRPWPTRPARTRTSTSRPPRSERWRRSPASSGRSAARTRTPSSSSTSPRSRSTCSGAGRPSRRPGACSGGRRKIDLRDGIAQTAEWLREQHLAPPVTMAKRALITGITGQDGSYLAELLLEKGYEVHGMVRRSSTETFQRLEGIRDAITLHTGDLLDQRSLVDVLRECEPRGDLQPRRDVVRGGVVEPAGADRRVQRRRRHADARGDARGGARARASTRPPRSEMFGKVLEVPAERDDALLPALPVRRGEGLRPLHHGQLPRDLRPVRLLGILFNHESRAPRAGVRDPQGHPRARPRSSSACRRAGARQPRRRARLGLREGLRRGDVADAPAGRARRLRDRHRRGAQRARAGATWPSRTSGSTPTTTCASTRASCARPRSST